MTHAENNNNTAAASISIMTIPMENDHDGMRMPDIPSLVITGIPSDDVSTTESVGITRSSGSAGSHDADENGSSSLSVGTTEPSARHEPGTSSRPEPPRSSSSHSHSHSHNNSPTHANANANANTAPMSALMIMRRQTNHDEKETDATNHHPENHGPVPLCRTPSFEKDPHSSSHTLSTAETNTSKTLPHRRHDKDGSPMSQYGTYLDPNHNGSHHPSSHGSAVPAAAAIRRPLVHSGSLDSNHPTNHHSSPRRARSNNNTSLRNQHLLLRSHNRPRASSWASLDEASLANRSIGSDRSSISLRSNYSGHLSSRSAGYTSGGGISSLDSHTHSHYHNMPPPLPPPPTVAHYYPAGGRPSPSSPTHAIYAPSGGFPPGSGHPPSNHHYLANPPPHPETGSQADVPGGGRSVDSLEIGRHGGRPTHPMYSHKDSFRVMAQNTANRSMRMGSDAKQEPNNGVSSSFPPRQVQVMETRQTKLSFDSVEIRSYQRVMGDNPSCSSGPSVSIGWEYDAKSTVSMSIEEYEGKKPHRLRDLEMILTRREREEMLLELGYTQSQIATNVRLNIRIKNQRRQTVNNLSVSAVEEAVEQASRKVKKLLHLGKKKSKTITGDKVMYQQWNAVEKQQATQPHDLKGSIKSSSASSSHSNSNSNHSNTSSQDNSHNSESASASHSSSSNNAMGSVPEYDIPYESRPPTNDHDQEFPRSDASDGPLHRQYRPPQPSPNVGSYTQGMVPPPPHPPHPQQLSQHPPQQQPFMQGYYYYVCDGKVYVPASPPQPVSTLYGGQDGNPNVPSHP